MSRPREQRLDSKPNGNGQSVEALLLRLDLATEVMEGLEELGVEDKDQLQALMTQLERQIADEG